MTDAHIRPVGYLDELRRIVPTEQIEPQQDGDEALGGSWAVEPATQIELVEVLRWANTRHAAVFTRRPRRGDSDHCGRRPRIYLRGRRMKRIKDLDVVSGTVTVQSGITMADLQRNLAERSFTMGFPTRPWRQESLGSVLAAALDAHWGPHYGSMEDQVCGLGVVFADGTTAGSRVAPRRAVGPDFDRLFLGSRGRFGIIYEATLRIYPTPSRIVLAYGAKDLVSALDAVRQAMDLGLEPRTIELLTPAVDRTWGRKRVGLTDAAPVLVIVEPWGPLAGRPVAWAADHFDRALTRLDPPAGWNVHEGLLPPPRAWRAPVVGVRWKRLYALAKTLGGQVPPGLWVVRMSRHGGWLSLASGAEGPGADVVRSLIEELDTPPAEPWFSLQEQLVATLDPKGILNPAPPAVVGA